MNNKTLTFAALIMLAPNLTPWVAMTMGIILGVIAFIHE